MNTTTTIDDIAIEEGSANPYADLGRPEMPTRCWSVCNCFGN